MKIKRGKYRTIKIGIHNTSIPHEAQISNVSSVFKIVTKKQCD